MDSKHLQNVITGVRDSVRAALKSRDELDQFAAETREIYARRDTMKKLAGFKPALAKHVELYDEAISRHGLVGLRCTTARCGATTRANCICGAPYVPEEQTRTQTSALFRAAQVIAAHPEWSNRKVAKELGIGETTVRRARENGAVDGAVARIGLDDKTRSLPKTKTSKTGKAVALPSADDDLIQDPCEDCETQEQFWQTSMSNVAGDAIAMRAYWTRIFGDWQSFNAPSSLVTLANQAATEWKSLAEFLQRRNR